MASAPDVVAASYGFMPSTTMFYMLLVPAILLYYAYWRISRRHLYELADKIEGPKGLPLLGNALEFVGTSHGNSKHQK